MFKLFDLISVPDWNIGWNDILAEMKLLLLDIFKILVLIVNFDGISEQKWIVT